jgi:hypothetical protein
MEEFERLWQTYLDHAVTLLKNIFVKPPVNECVRYSIDEIAELVEEKGLVLELPEKPVTPGVLDEVALRILRGLGHIEFFYWKGSRYAVLTPLGDIVRRFTIDESIPVHIKRHALILSSLPFTTKMRVIYGLYYMHGVNYGMFVATLRGRILAYDLELGMYAYQGVERPALEAYLELILTEAGRSRRAISETEILTMLLEVYTQQFGGRKPFNEEFFSPLNRKTRYDHYWFFSPGMYKSATWEALKGWPAKNIDETLQRHNLAGLQPLINKLREKFGDADRILSCLYSLP